MQHKRRAIIITILEGQYIYIIIIIKYYYYYYSFVTKDARFIHLLPKLLTETLRHDAFNM